LGQQAAVAWIQSTNTAKRYPSSYYKVITMDANNEDDELLLLPQKEIKRLRIEIKRSPAPIDEGTLIELDPRGNDDDTGGEDAPRITNCPLREQLESALHRRAELEEAGQRSSTRRRRIGPGGNSQSGFGGMSDLFAADVFWISYYTLVEFLLRKMVLSGLWQNGGQKGRAGDCRIKPGRVR
jgi:hypothetical protein